MIEYYPQIKYIHILLAMFSGTFFAIRGLGALARAQWPQQSAVKMLSYAIDISLLAAALLLLSIVPWTMFSNGWLLMKLALLVVYVVLGVYALRRAQRLRTRALCYGSALLVFIWMATIARAHHPLGWLARFVT